MEFEQLQSQLIERVRGVIDEATLAAGFAEHAGVCFAEELCEVLRSQYAALREDLEGDDEEAEGNPAEHA